MIYQYISEPGDTSYIHQSMSGLQTEENLEYTLSMLANMLRQDPSAIKTISQTEADKIINPKKKYRGGGFLGFGKKKDPEVPKNEVLMLIDAILSSQLPEGEFKKTGPGGRTIQQDVMPYVSDRDQRRWKGRQIAKFDTPEGRRYYPGEGTSQDMQMSLTKALMDATMRQELSPADSITTDQLKVLKELGLF